MLDLLENLAISLDEASNCKSLVASLMDFFIKNFKVERLEVYVFDEKLSILKDFSKEWVNLDKPAPEEVLQQFENLNKERFEFINNTLFYSLPRAGKSIGMLIFKVSNPNKLIDFLRNASFLISLKIQNIVLADNMQKSIDFHELMRNVAKIIETQYELKYIIPLLGEMLDKFMSNNLIYIFLKNNAKFDLIWPASCKDETILNRISELREPNETIIINEQRIGLFPLINEGKIIGCIAAKSMVGEINNFDIAYLEQLAKQVAVTINRAKVYSEILKHATLDALTGFYNRRQLDERIKQETAKAKRQKTNLCAIMADIDFFKHVNDVYGHAAGDLVLKTVSKTMRSHLREYDIAGRYGGEEFAILLPFTKTSEAIMVAERLRKAVENKKIDLSKVNNSIKEKSINVTISIGIYEFKNSDNSEDLLKEADKALYEAKETGRNKVVVNGK